LNFPVPFESSSFVLLPPFDGGSVALQAVEMIYAATVASTLGLMLMDNIPESADCNNHWDNKHVVHYNEDELQARRVILHCIS
jgi:hypothetical protein